MYTGICWVTLEELLNRSIIIHQVNLEAWFSFLFTMRLNDSNVLL